MAVTVYGERYWAMLNEFLFTKIALNDNIREAFGEIQCRLLNGQPRQLFPLLAGRIVLSNKKRKEHSVVFVKAFKQTFFGETYIKNYCSSLESVRGK